LLRPPTHLLSFVAEHNIERLWAAFYHASTAAALNDNQLRQTIIAAAVATAMWFGPERGSPWDCQPTLTGLLKELFVDLGCLNSQVLGGMPLHT
jgi:hypothetical protein